MILNIENIVDINKIEPVIEVNYTHIHQSEVYFKTNLRFCGKNVKIAIAPRNNRTVKVKTVEYKECESKLNANFIWTDVTDYMSKVTLDFFREKYFEEAKRRIESKITNAMKRSEFSNRVRQASHEYSSEENFGGMSCSESGLPWGF